MTSYYEQPPGDGVGGGTAGEPRWWHRTKPLVAALVLLPPAGVALLWTRPTPISVRVRKWVTVAASVWTIVLIGIGASDPQVQTTQAASTTSTASATPTRHPASAASSTPSPTATPATTTAAPTVAPTTAAATTPAPAPPPRPRPAPTTTHRPSPPPAAPPRTQAPPPPPPATPAGPACDPSYPDVCIPPLGVRGDLDCPDVPYTDFRVLPPDPHGFDRDHDGVGCES